MTELVKRLSADPALRDAYARAHRLYLADRTRIDAVPEIAHVSAGGMPTRIKCLHALVAHALAAGRGVNPVGDLALERADWSPLVCVCDHGADKNEPGRP